MQYTNRDKGPIDERGRWVSMKGRTREEAKADLAAVQAGGEAAKKPRESMEDRLNRRLGKRTEASPDKAAVETETSSLEQNAEFTDAKAYTQTLEDFGGQIDYLVTIRAKDWTIQYQGREGVKNPLLSDQLVDTIDQYMTDRGITQVDAAARELAAAWYRAAEERFDRVLRQKDLSTADRDAVLDAATKLNEKFGRYQTVVPVRRRAVGE